MHAYAKNKTHATKKHHCMFAGSHTDESLPLAAGLKYQHISDRPLMKDTLLLTLFVSAKQTLL